MNVCQPWFSHTIKSVRVLLFCLVWVYITAPPQKDVKIFIFFSLKIAFCMKNEKKNIYKVKFTSILFSFLLFLHFLKIVNKTTKNTIENMCVSTTTTTMTTVIKKTWIFSAFYIFFLTFFYFYFLSFYY